jgi:hypothetical protein
MARGTPKGLASARSEIKNDYGDMSPEYVYKMNQQAFNVWETVRRSRGMTYERLKEIRNERYNWQQNRNKERREAKPAKEANEKRIANLSQSLVSEMEPYQNALAQRIFDDEKEVQASVVSMGINYADLLKMQKDGKDSYQLPLLQREDSRTSLRPKRLVDGTPITLYNSTYSRWIEKDPEATRALEERLIADGKNVQGVFKSGTSDKYLVLNGNSGTKFAIPIVAYRQNPLAPTDESIMGSARSTAKDVIASYATKLVKKTEDLVGKESEVTGNPKVSSVGNNPWGESKVEVNMGGKKVVWKTKMIWNRSKLDKDFNQFPTRLVSQEDA